MAAITAPPVAPTPDAKGNVYNVPVVGGNGQTTNYSGEASGLSAYQQSVGMAAPVSQGSATAKTSEPTVYTSANIDDKNQANVATAVNTPKTGLNVGPEGFVKNADQSFAEAPSDAVQVNDASGSSYWQSGGVTYALGPSGGKVSSDPLVQGIYEQFTQLKSQMDATGAATIQAIKDQYESLIREQKSVNAGSEAASYSLLARGGSLQTDSSGGIQQGQISYGLGKIADLTGKENAAIATAQAAIQSNDMELLDKQLTIASGARKERQDAAAKLAETINTARTTAATNSAVVKAMQAGNASPADILKSLTDQGFSVTAKNVADTLSALNPDAQAIHSLLLSATESNAPLDVRAAIGKATNYTDALQAGGSWISSNSDVQLYNRYRSEATAKGQTPINFDSYMANKRYLDAFNAAKGTAAGKAAGEGSAAGSTLSQSSIKTKADFPQTLKPYAKQSGNGTWYLDLSSIGANLRPSLINQAGDLPVITDKNQAADLVNIKDAYGKLKTISDAMGNMTSSSALSRALGGAGLTELARIAQTNPKKAAAQALNDSALDFLKAISGVQGFRGNQSAIQQIKDSLPKITDTQDVAAQKLSYISQQIADREEATLGERGSRNVTDFVVRSEDQAKNALVTSAKNDAEIAPRIDTILNETNPDSGQPYTYLEAAQILGIDIPALQEQTSIFKGGTLLPNLWRELNGQGI